MCMCCFTVIKCNSGFFPTKTKTSWRTAAGIGAISDTALVS